MVNLINQSFKFWRCKSCQILQDNLFENLNLKLEYTYLKVKMCLIINFPKICLETRKHDKWRIFVWRLRWVAAGAAVRRTRDSSAGKLMFRDMETWIIIQQFGRFLANMDNLNSKYIQIYDHSGRYNSIKGYSLLYKSLSWGWEYQEKILKRTLDSWTLKCQITYLLTLVSWNLVPYFHSQDISF